MTTTQKPPGQKSGNVEPVFERHPRVVTCDLEDEMVLLSLESEKYYGLDVVGARVWALLETPKRLAELRDRLLDEFDVERERLEADLARLCDDLIAEALITRRDA